MKINNEECYIVVDGTCALVVGNADDSFENDTLEKDNAYIHENQCYIYGGKLPEEPEPGYFYKSGKKLVFIPAIHPEMSTVENIKNMTQIRQEVTDRQFIKDSAEDIDLTDPKVFAPAIREDDDPLKKLMKMVLQELQIDMREYGKKFAKDYDMSNLKGSITKSTPLSIKYFLRCCDVFDLRCTITVSSRSKHAKHKLDKEIKIVIE